MLTRRPRRHAERGQVLIMALAFVAFFALVTTAVLQFADAVELQQVHTQSAAGSHAEAEGGMLLAAQAAEQSGAGCVVNSPPTPVTLTMTTGDTATYEITGCNPGTTADLLTNQCAVCVLGGQPATVNGVLEAQGPIVFNDGVTGSGTVSSDPGIVACGKDASGCSTASLTPSPAATLGGTANPATPGLPHPFGACRNLEDDDGTFDNPVGSGYYCSDTGTIQWDGSETSHHYLSGGSTLIIGTPLDISNTTVSVEGWGGVTIDFLTGSSLEIGNGGQMSGDITLVFGPHGTGSEICGTTGGTTKVICVVRGGTLDVSGGVSAPAGTMLVQAGAAADVSGEAEDGSGNALVLGDLTVSSQGPQTGSLQVDASPPTGGYCWVYQDDVLDGTGPPIGRVLVEAACSGETAGIIAIDYSS